MQTTESLVRGSGRGQSPLEAKTSCFWTFNGSHKFVCFL